MYKIEKKPSLTWCVFTMLSMLVLGMIYHQTYSPTAIDGAEIPDYVLTLDASSAPASSSEYDSFEHTVRYTQFQYDNAKASPGNHVELGEWGGIYNLSQITSITSVTATFSTLGTLTMWTSYDQINYFEYPLVSGVTISLSNLPYMVEFWADNEPVTIERIAITYTCTPHEESLDKYQVIWRVDEENILETDTEVEVGAFPSYDGPTPAKEASGSMAYVFSGWFPALREVDGNQVYTATFSEIEMTFMLINDGTEYRLTSASDRSLTTLEIPSYYNGLPVTEIGEGVFEVNDITNESFAFESITLPNQLRSIGSYAFFGCSSLTSITLPESVSEIGNHAFIGCSSLASIQVDTNNLTYSSIDGVLYNADGTSLVLYPVAKATTYTIPNGVTSIGDAAFATASLLTQVNLASTLTSIGAQAFLMCTSLENIVIPDSVLTIGPGAFFNCTSLTSVSLSNSLTTISSSLFYGCTSLFSITLPNTITLIDSQAFYGCSGLTSITLNEGLTLIGTGAFSSCVLLNNVTLPSTLLRINASAFSYCIALTRLTLPSSLTTLGSNVFANCRLLSAINVGEGNTSFSAIDGVLFNVDATSLITYPVAKLDPTYSVPATVTTITSFAFRYNPYITTINLPSSVATIGDYALSNCNALNAILVDSSNPNLSSLDGVLFNKDVTTLIAYPAGKTTSDYAVPASVTTIISAGIAYNPHITTLYIPDTVTTIMSHGINSCPNLSIYCQASVKPLTWHDSWNVSASPVTWAYII